MTMEFSRPFRPPSGHESPFLPHSFPPPQKSRWGGRGAQENKLGGRERRRDNNPNPIPPSLPSQGSVRLRLSVSPQPPDVQQCSCRLGEAYQMLLRTKPPAPLYPCSSDLLLASGQG